jgi:hypothetical protein
MAGSPQPSAQPVQAADVGFAVLPDERGGTNVESIVYTDAMGFDKRTAGSSRNAMAAAAATFDPHSRSRTSLRKR